MMKVYPPLPPDLAKEVGITLFRMAKATSGPKEFVVRLSQILEATLIAVTGNMTEEQMIASMDATEAFVRSQATQPPGRA